MTSQRGLVDSFENVLSVAFRELHGRLVAEYRRCHGLASAPAGTVHTVEGIRIGSISGQHQEAVEFSPIEAHRISMEATRIKLVDADAFDVSEPTRMSTPKSPSTVQTLLSSGTDVVPLSSAGEDLERIQDSARSSSYLTHLSNVSRDNASKEVSFKTASMSFRVASDAPSMAQVESGLDSHCFVVHEVFTKFTTNNKKTTRRAKHCRTVDFDEVEEQMEDFEGCCIRILNAIVVPPTFIPRIIWDLIGFVFVLYHFVMVPLATFNPEETGFTVNVDWLQRVYWTLDLAFNFFTGYTTIKGDVCMDVRRIASHYIRTWLTIDFFVVLCDWLEFVSKGSDVFGSFQGLRILRLFKLLRLARMVFHMPDVTDTVVSSRVHADSLKMVGGTLKLMAMAAGFLHLVACGWYGLSTLTNDDQMGWVYKTKVQQESLIHRYLMSYHWSITQLIGSADISPHGPRERAFAIVVLFSAFVITASVVSSITTSMTQLQIITAQKSKQLSLLHKYLVDHNLPAKLVMRVEHNARYTIDETMHNIQEKDVELLHMISEPLRIELHYEIYRYVLHCHPFFTSYDSVNKHAMRQVCHHCISHRVMHRGDVLFSQGEQKQHPEMYFVIKGSLLYFKGDTLERTLREDGMAGEPSLWTIWSHQGTLRATGHCAVLCLSAKSFHTIAEQFKSSSFWPAVYAQKYVEELNELHCSQLTDMHDPETLDTHHLAKGVFMNEMTGTGSMIGTSSNRATGGKPWAKLQHSTSNVLGFIKKHTSEKSASRVSVGSEFGAVPSWNLAPVAENNRGDENTQVAAGFSPVAPDPEPPGSPILLK